MRSIDQNSAVQSLNLALDTGSALIDGRNEVDRLHFLTEFGSLINFYDQENKINGDWNPFLMKDPVFLLATITKTNFNRIHDLYVETCSNIQKSISKSKKPKDKAEYFNQLLSQLLKIFMRIERWGHFMHTYHADYNLKKYVLHRIETKFASYFWALVSLWQYLLERKLISGIDPINTYLFDNYDQKIWQNSKDQEPFWIVLNIPILDAFKPVTTKPSVKELLLGVLDGLTYAGDQLFSFLHDIIEHSAADYDSIKVAQSQFPDTVLLRAFVKLQEVQQQQLNGITRKHLQFYYKDILKQTKKNAQADKAFINANLSLKDSTLSLPKGTLFNAGLDAHKQTILFETLINATLNPGSITGGFTLVQKPATKKGKIIEGMISLYKETVTSPGVLKKDEEGNTVAWETFGGGSLVATDPQSMGFSFSSPMLLLVEGIRTLTITMTFKKPINPKLFNNATYFLSTQKDWLSLQNSNTPVVVPVDTNTCQIEPNVSVDKLTFIVTVTLGSAIPGIEKFTKNPDGFDAAWPMFKMTFDQFVTTLTPKPETKTVLVSPELSTINVQTDVQGVKTFELYNDTSKLTAKIPFPLFGPTPLVNSSFFIGSAEVFSKPLLFLDLDFTWGNLPKSLDFKIYYKEYNDNMSLTDGNSQLEKDVETAIKKVVTTKSESILNKILNSIKVVYKKMAAITALEKDVETAVKNAVTITSKSLLNNILKSMNNVFKKPGSDDVKFAVLEKDIETAIKNVITSTSESLSIEILNSIKDPFEKAAVNNNDISVLKIDVETAIKNLIHITSEFLLNNILNPINSVFKIATANDVDFATLETDVESSIVSVVPATSESLLNTIMDSIDGVFISALKTDVETAIKNIEPAPSESVLNKILNSIEGLFNNAIIHDVDIAVIETDVESAIKDVLTTTSESFLNKILSAIKVSFNKAAANDADIATLETNVETAVKSVVPDKSLLKNILTSVKGVFIAALETEVESAIVNVVPTTSESILNNILGSIKRVFKKTTTKDLDVSALETDVNTAIKRVVPAAEKPLLKRILESIKVLFNKAVVFNFTNTCFIVDFKLLQNSNWVSFLLNQKDSCTYDSSTLKYSCNSPDISSAPSLTNSQLMYNSESGCVTNSNLFAYQVSSPKNQIDPDIQSIPLAFTDKSAYGFMRMNLVGPSLGFGSSIYSKIVSNIALKNAGEMMKKNKTAPIHQPANVPFVPKVKSLTADYSASQLYTMDFSQTDIPIQCYTYTPFENYQVYDSDAKPSTYADLVNTTLDGRINKPASNRTKIPPPTSLPLFPSLNNKGVLYLSMDNIVAPSQLNLFFDLNRKVEDVSSTRLIEYKYLTPTGWATMDVLSDGTKNFTCSGLIKVNVSDDISCDHITMPTKQYWLSIGVENDPSSYPDTVFLQSNGLELERTGTSFLSDSTAPSIKAGSITGPAHPIAEITSVVQTFPSFGGWRAETEPMMNHRISTRLKTKDRVINTVDYFRIIAQKYPDIYYSKTVFNRKKNTTDVYLVKKFDDVNVAGAYLPLVSECKEEIVTEFLKKRASAFANIKAINFKPVYVTITASIVVNTDKGLQGMEKDINADLKLFLSPWITSATDQLPIDQGLATAQIATFIKSLDGVVGITKLVDNTSTKNTGGKKPPGKHAKGILPATNGELYVTAPKHLITCTYLT